VFADELRYKSGFPVSRDCNLDFAKFARDGLQRVTIAHVAAIIAHCAVARMAKM